MAAPEIRVIAERLSEAQILRDYEAAFASATGLPFAFQPVGAQQAKLREATGVNPFCLRISQDAPDCSNCSATQERLCAEGAETKTHTCIAGLTDTSVPVRLGDRTLGYLQTGQVALKKLTRDQFQKVINYLMKDGVQTDWKALESEYFESPQMSAEKFRAVQKLLEVFAEHLALAAEQLATRESNSEPAMVVKAREFISRHQDDEDLSLASVARAVNTSTFHFCKQFKKTTGLTFTQYVSMVRVSRAKQLLANPQKRITEVAFEAGFQSITNFNRTFRSITGKSPTHYREEMSAN